MKKIKTSELAGATLNFAVSVIEGYRAEDLRRSFGDSLDVLLRDERGALTGMVQTGHTYLSWLSPLGGRIIEREYIATNVLRSYGPERRWMASPNGGDNTPSIPQYGPAPLIAAMRCFVVSRLGDEVEVPEELLR